ncbi:MAG: citryl-CoA lyase [Granulosicoccus sp.]|nr:citryl-CoA lyase [Granulosicoccus sp.]
MSTEAAAQWWSTDIIKMSPGEIRFHGYAIEELIGNISFTQMIWLMLRSELPQPGQDDLLEAALMSAVDHGPQAPSIAIARMAATCGVGLNSAMASGLNVLGDIHGGAGEQAVELYSEIANNVSDSSPLVETTQHALQKYQTAHDKYVPGFGHRFHPVDPRAPRLLALVDKAVTEGIVLGHHLAAAREIEHQLAHQQQKIIPMNIDGASAVIYAELGFAAPLARGLFCLSRSVGILAHAWEQTQQGGRNKGPIPRDTIWNYSGHADRSLGRGA